MTLPTTMAPSACGRERAGTRKLPASRTRSPMPRSPHSTAYAQAPSCRASRETGSSPFAAAASLAMVHPPPRGARNVRGRRESGALVSLGVPTLALPRSGSSGRRRPGRPLSSAFPELPRSPPGPLCRHDILLGFLLSHSTLRRRGVWRLRHRDAQTLPELLVATLPDVLATDHVDHHLGDVGGVVGDPLQVPGDQDERGGRAGSCAGSAIMKVSSSRKIWSLSASTSSSAAHTARASSVSRAHEGVQALLAPCAAPARPSAAGRCSGLSWGSWFSSMRALGDVHRLVADALEVGDDLHGGGDEAQVARRRLVQREQLHALLVHLDVVGGSPAGRAR